MADDQALDWHIVHLSQESNLPQAQDIRHKWAVHKHLDPKREIPVVLDMTVLAHRVVGHNLVPIQHMLRW
jgi:hypothetical protein